MDAIDRRMAEINARIERERAARLGLASDENWGPFCVAGGSEAPRGVPPVSMSNCGRYTIVEWFALVGHDGARYQAFRRHGPPEEARKAPPSWTELFRDPAAARRGCAEHFARTGGRHA